MVSRHFKCSLVCFFSSAHGKRGYCNQSKESLKRRNYLKWVSVRAFLLYIFNEYLFQWVGVACLLQQILFSLFKVLNCYIFIEQKSAMALKVDNKLPNLVNLNEDPQLSEVLVYVLRKGKTRVGRARDGCQHDILLNGPLIEDDHWWDRHGIWCLLFKCINVHCCLSFFLSSLFADCLVVQLGISAVVRNASSAN